MTEPVQVVIHIGVPTEPNVAAVNPPDAGGRPFRGARWWTPKPTICELIEFVETVRIASRLGYFIRGHNRGLAWMASGAG